MKTEFVVSPIQLKDGRIMSGSPAEWLTKDDVFEVQFGKELEKWRVVRSGPGYVVANEMTWPYIKNYIFRKDSVAWRSLLASVGRGDEEEVDFRCFRYVGKYIPWWKFWVRYN